MFVFSIFKVDFVMELSERQYLTGCPNKHSSEEIGEENTQLNGGFYIQISPTCSSSPALVDLRFHTGIPSSRTESSASFTN